MMLEFNVSLSLASTTNIGLIQRTRVSRRQLCTFRLSIPTTVHIQQSPIGIDFVLYSKICHTKNK